MRSYVIPWGLKKRDDIGVGVGGGGVQWGYLDLLNGGTIMTTP